MYGLAGRVGVSCLDVNGDTLVAVPSWQGVRLDHPEVMAASKAKHCATCEVASKAQLAQHPPRRPLRRAAETERLIRRALEAERARTDALAANPIDRAARRRTKRRLERLARKVARRGLHCLDNSFFGLVRTHPFMVFTWSELHIIWQGTLRNLINLVIEQRSGKDGWPAELALLDAAFKRWASPMASVKGKAKAGGLSILLAREGDIRLSRTTKHDTYGLALFFRPMCESLLDADTSEGLAHFWAWVHLTRTRNPETGQHELRQSQLEGANANEAASCAAST